jgi:hypothetical protein
MKRPVSTLLVALAQAFPLLICALSGTGAIGCNTAQISQAAPVDAGPPCSVRTPILTCDGGSTSPTACSGGVTLSPDVGENVDASSLVPVGSYDVNCTVSFWVQDVASPDCLPTEPCTCTGADGGAASPDGGAASPGVWSCIPAQ